MQGMFVGQHTSLDSVPKTDLWLGKGCLVHLLFVVGLKDER